MTKATHKITLTVRMDSDGDLWYESRRPSTHKTYSAGYISKYAIIDNIEKLPTPIVVGDIVTWGVGAVNYTVQFIDDEGFATLRNPDGTWRTIKPVVELRIALED